MRLVILAHPLFLKSESMPRFARMLLEGFTAAGHEVTLLRPDPYVYRVFGSSRFAKWASYFDQYLVFPFKLIAWDFHAPADTLFIFADQALGPWVPYIRRHRKIVHCLDLLALKSAFGLIPENPTSLTGKLYQRYIRWGFQHCRNFISISKRTATDLEKFGNIGPKISEAIHLSLNYPYQRIKSDDVHKKLSKSGIDAGCDGYLLYVGGGQWYKNRRGLLRIYQAYAEANANPLPLICVSPSPGHELLSTIQQLPAQAKVSFVQGVDGETLEALYSGARLMLFPSLAEGFGWPIVEAQACGCPVITTDDSPMNEISGPVARLLRPLSAADDLDAWAQEGAAVIAGALRLTPADLLMERQAAMAWADRFKPGMDIAKYLIVYHQVLNSSL